MRILFISLAVLGALFLLVSCVSGLTIGVGLGGNVTVNNNLSNSTNQTDMNNNQSSNETQHNNTCVVMRDPHNHIWKDCIMLGMQIRTRYPDYIMLDNRGLIPGIDRDEYSSKSKGGHTRPENW